MVLYEHLTKMALTELVYVFRSSLGADTITNMNNRRSNGLSFKLSGKSEYYQEGKTYISDNKNIIFLPVNSNYTAKTVEDSECIVVNFKTSTEFENKELVQISVMPEHQPKLTELLEKLVELNNKEFCYYASMSILYEIMDLVMSKNNRSQNNAFYPIIEYINENLSKSNITNKELANLFGYSEVHFRKSFKRQFGISPIQYIIDRRINVAKQLLLSQSFSVTQISEMVGFSSIYHFSRLFKQHTGLSPNQYIKQNTDYGEF